MGLEATYMYKHTSMQQKQVVSDLLYCQGTTLSSSSPLQVAHPHAATLAKTTQLSGSDSTSHHLPLPVKPSTQCPVQVNSTDTLQSLSMTCTSSSMFSSRTALLPLMLISSCYINHTNSVLSNCALLYVCILTLHCCYLFHLGRLRARGVGS